jgi:hypothetical protein
MPGPKEASCDETNWRTKPPQLLFFVKKDPYPSMEEGKQNRKGFYLYIISRSPQMKPSQEQS